MEIHGSAGAREHKRNEAHMNGDWERSRIPEVDNRQADKE